MDTGEFKIRDGILVQYNGPGGDAVLPGGIRYIGRAAFFECRKLTSVTVPEGVAGIGEGAFAFCSSLTAVLLPPGLTEIVSCAFAECEKLASVAIPGSVKRIGYGAFRDCVRLSSLTIGDGVKHIGGTAFYKCESLTSVMFPKSMRMIEDFAFAECPRLRRAFFPGPGGLSIGRGAFDFGVPALIAPHKLPSSFPKDLFSELACGYAVAAAEGHGDDFTYREEYLRQIQEKRKELLPYALREPALLRLMTEESLLLPRDCEELMDRLQDGQDLQARALLLEYAHRKHFPLGGGDTL